MICVIGSQAIVKQGVPFKTPRDLDFVCTYDELIAFAKTVDFGHKESYPSNGGKKWVIKGTKLIVEAELAWPDSIAAELVQLILADKKTLYADGFAYASIDVCYMLKMSHRYLRNSPHFLKTMRHIHMLRKMGAKIRKEHREFYKKRVEATYWYKHPSLMKNKSDFFNGDGVNYVYDHDSMHESVALDGKPAYTHFQSDNAEVQCDMNKFFALPEQVRLNAVCEESMVLALERAIVPFNVPPLVAYKKALEKVCTSITSGKFREYAWENYDKALAMFDEKIFERFWQHVEQGKVKLHNPNVDTMMAAQ